MPSGPHANRTVPAGTCLISNTVAPSNRLTRLEWSYMQASLAGGANPWVTGKKSTSGEVPQVMEDASGYWGECTSEPLFARSGGLTAQPSAGAHRRPHLPPNRPLPARPAPGGPHNPSSYAPAQRIGNT